MRTNSVSQLTAPRLFGDIERFAARTALVDETGREVTYAELIDLGRSFVEPLGEARKLVFIEIENALAPIAAYVGALRAGHAVVLTGEGGGHRDSRLARIFGPEAVFLNGWQGWGFESRTGAPLDLNDEVAVLLSTSGSTGSPKLVRLSHEALIANALSIGEYLALAPGERAMTSLPAAYSYGMSVINSHLIAGHALILSDDSVTEPAFWDRFHQHGATSFAGVPHTYELLEHTGFLASDHPSLRYFTQAGGKLAADKVKRFAEWAGLRGHRFYVMYGQTEAGPRMAYVPPEALAAHPDVIGVAVPGGELRIEDDELIYRGPNVMLGYANDREDLVLGRQVEELRTGDLATQNEAGFFRITGRASRFSKMFGLRISLDEVEAMLAQAGAEGVAAGDDEGLVLAVVGAEGEALRKTLADRLKLPPARLVVAEVAEIPRQASGKVDYPAVLRLRGGPAPAPAPAPTAAPSPARLAAKPRPRVVSGDLRRQMANILGVPAIGDTDTFIGLGGDSLSYVQASILLEGHLGAPPDGWESMTFAALEGGARAPAAPAPAGDLRRQMAEILGVRAIKDSDTFISLGGDSLSYVQASVLLESRLGAAPAGWESMAFNELDRGAAAAPRPAEARRAQDEESDGWERMSATMPSRATSLESSVLVRAIAISLVVFHHVSNWELGGAATALLMVAGINFARFQLPRLSQPGGSAQLFQSTLIRVVLPYFAVLTLYFLIIGQVFWPQFLLYSNFTDGLVWQGIRRFKVYWFIEVYLTLILALCALFLIPQVRTFSRDKPKALAISVFALAVAAAAFAKPLTAAGVLYVHTLPSAAYIFVFGWLIEKLKSPRERLALLAIGLLTVFVLPTDEELIAIPVLAAFAILLLFVRKVPLGAGLTRLVSLVAGASFYIYIFHAMAPHAARLVFGRGEWIPGWALPVVFLVSLASGLTAWWAVDFATSRRAKAWLSSLQAQAFGRGEGRMTLAAAKTDDSRL